MVRNTMRRLAIRSALIFTASTVSATWAQEPSHFPVTLSNLAVKPIELNLTAPSEGRVLEVPPIDAITGLLDGLRHPFAVARVEIDAPTAEISRLKSELNSIRNTLLLQRFYFDELDPNHFRLFGQPAPSYDPIEEAARNIIAQREELDQEFLSANLADPWGTNAIDPAQLRALFENRVLRESIETLKSRVNGQITDNRAALGLAKVALRSVRHRKGYEVYRVAQSPTHREPLMPNSNDLFRGGVPITLSIDFANSLRTCDDLARYWVLIEEAKLWTQQDVMFAERIAGRNWLDRAQLPFVTRTDSSVPLIGAELERECDAARRQREHLLLLRRIAELAATSIDIEKGLTPTPEQIAVEVLGDAEVFTRGAERNRREFAVALGSARLLELTRQEGAQATAHEEDVRKVTWNVLIELEKLKWDNVRFRSERSLSSHEKSNMQRTLLALSRATVDTLYYRGRLLHIIEEPEKIYPRQFEPRNFADTSFPSNEFDRGFRSIDSRLGFAVVRLDDSSRPLDLRISAAADATLLTREAELERRRLAQDLYARWRAISFALNDLQRRYDFGHLWAPEPVRIVNVLVRPDERVATGQLLVIGEALRRFRVHVPLGSAEARVLSVIPLGVSISVKVNVAGVPPISSTAKQTILGSTARDADMRMLKTVYARSVQELTATAIIKEKAERHIVLDISTDLNSMSLSPQSGDETALFERLKFSCSVERVSNQSKCTFPLGPFGEHSMVTLALTPTVSHDTQRAATMLGWSELVKP